MSARRYKYCSGVVVTGDERECAIRLFLDSATVHITDHTIVGAVHVTTDLQQSNVTLHTEWRQERVQFTTIHLDSVHQPIY